MVAWDTESLTRLLRADVIRAAVDGRERGRIYLSLADPESNGTVPLAKLGESIYLPESFRGGCSFGADIVDDWMSVASNDTILIYTSISAFTVIRKTTCL
jgi:hypothetical protein